MTHTTSKKHADATHPPFREESYSIAIDPDAAGEVSNGRITIAPHRLEVIRYRFNAAPWKVYVRAIGRVVRKTDGMHSRITRVVTWSDNPESVALPLSEMPRWARDVYDRVMREAEK